MKPSDYLKRGHTKEAFARDKSGAMTGATNHDAVCWCLYGAMIVALRTSDNIATYEVAVRRIIGTYSIGEWNDAPERTQAEVVALAERVERELGTK